MEWSPAVFGYDALTSGQTSGASTGGAAVPNFSFSPGPWARLEGRARRPLASQASTSKSALLGWPNSAASAGRRQTDEDRLLIARLDIDHAIGHEPGLREGRGEQVLPGETPEHPATQPRSNSRRKERRGGAVDRAMAAAGHLMQRAERQSPTREMLVDRLDAEGQYQSPATGRALEAPDARAKLLETGTGDGCAHVLGNGLGGEYVPYLFS